MSVWVRLPAVLATITGGARDFEADGATIAAALGDLAARHPALRAHFFDEAGSLRLHLQFVHDGVYVRARDAAQRPLAVDDRLVVMNAVSGG